VERIPNAYIIESVIHGIGIICIGYFNTTYLPILLSQREMNKALRQFPVGFFKV